VARLLLYALGGGRGHLVRSLALGRAAAKRGHRVHVLTNSPYASQAYASEIGPEGTLQAIASDTPRDACARIVETVIESAPWDALILDTFPRGLGGELADLLGHLSCARVWVHRNLTQSYVKRFKLRTFAAQFDSILVPGESAPLDDLPHARRTAPWLVRDATELLTREDARDALGATAATPLVVVVGTGKPEEVEIAQRRAALLGDALRDRATVRFLTDRWPLIELLPGVDVLVGAGGYNTVYEARATQTPLVAVPQPRLYDRQSGRLRRVETSSEPTLAADVQAALESSRLGAERPSYENGVHQALDVIEETIEQRTLTSAGGKPWR
jgi:UDP:flavonoid glycosyltransferase YjiC (YdhE family)